jgi:hypothetical protein
MWLKTAADIAESAMPVEATIISNRFGRYGTAKSIPTTAVIIISETTFSLQSPNKSAIDGIVSINLFWNI